MGYPFVSLTTASDALAQAYLDFALEITGKQKAPNRNARDNIYNIVSFKEDAQALAATMYYPGCLALPRKMAKAQEVLAWVRPADMRHAPPRKAWTPEQDAFILSHSIAESMEAPSRTEKSISCRLWCLRHFPLLRRD
jgi:hypothetical protein